MIDKPGIYQIPAANYHADEFDTPPTLSKSIIWQLMNRSPLHAKHRHPRLVEEPLHEESEKFDIGKTVHSLFLEGIDSAMICDALNKEGELVSDWKTKAARKFREDARAEGKTPLLARHVPEIKNICGRLREQLDQHEEARDAFTAGQPELTLLWRESNGVWCKARPDWLHDSHQIMDDLKTTERGDPYTLSRSFVGLGWDLQAAFYRRGLMMVDPKVEPQFRFISIEVDPPYALTVTALDPKTIAIADRKVQRAIEMLGECLYRNVWPAYPQRVCYLELPAWEQQRFEESESQR